MNLNQTYSPIPYLSYSYVIMWILKPTPSQPTPHTSVYNFGTKYFPVPTTAVLLMKIDIKEEIYICAVDSKFSCNFHLKNVETKNFTRQNSVLKKCFIFDGHSSYLVNKSVRV